MYPLKKMILTLLSVMFILAGCSSHQDVVTDSTLLERVEITKVDTESCGENCTDYIVSIVFKGKPSKYKVNNELYVSIKNYRNTLKKETGSTESVYNVVVLPKTKQMLAISPVKNHLK